MTGDKDGSKVKVLHALSEGVQHILQAALHSGGIGSARRQHRVCRAATQGQQQLKRNGALKQCRTHETSMQGLCPLLTGLRQIARSQRLTPLFGPEQRDAPVAEVDDLAVVGARRGGMHMR